MFYFLRAVFLYEDGGQGKKIEHGGSGTEYEEFLGLLGGRSLSVYVFIEWVTACLPFSLGSTVASRRTRKISRSHCPLPKPYYVCNLVCVVVNTTHTHELGHAVAILDKFIYSFISCLQTIRERMRTFDLRPVMR